MTASSPPVGRSLAEWLLAALPGPAHVVELEERLAALWSRARAAWPGLDLDAAALMTRLARHAAPDAVDGYLDDVHVEDLALACALDQHHPGAIRELEARYARIVPRALGRVGAAALADEIVQHLRDRFLVRRKIADYSGRGPLDAWIRAAAVRAAIDLLRAQRSDGGGDVEALPAAAVDPELDLLRGRYGEVIQEALQRALDALPARERNLLRFSYVDALSIDEIGAFYRIHRTTAGRWVAHARDALVAEMRRLVRDRLALGDSELDSVLRAVRSVLHISLGRLRY